MGMVTINVFKTAELTLLRSTYSPAKFREPLLNNDVTAKTKTLKITIIQRCRFRCSFVYITIGELNSR